MSLLSAVRTYLVDYTGLKDGAPLWVNYLGSQPTEYAIVPMAGGKILERWLNGGSLREFPFAIQSVESTADDLERMESAGFFESLADWLENQTVLPALDEGKTAISIEASGWAYLFEQGKSETGIYQIQCRLVYEQAPYEEPEEPGG